MKKFTAINEKFTCKNCGEKNPKLACGCRNHCRECLFSLHLDQENPGDRKSDCKGIMEPIKINQSGKKGWIIYHKCTKCGKVISNKMADDDNFNEIINLSQPQY